MWKWLCSPPVGARERARLFLGLFTLDVLWGLACGLFVWQVYGTSLIMPWPFQDPMRVVMATAKETLFEELLRIVPLAITLRLTSRPAVILAAAVLTAAVFGYQHEGMFAPWYYVLCQGGGGLLYNVAYLKWRGIPKGQSNGFFFAWSLHCVYDLLIFGAMLAAAYL